MIDVSALIEELDAYYQAEARDEWPEIVAAAKEYLALLENMDGVIA